MNVVYKALLLPYNENFEVMLQDRTGHRPPPWGFFGGGVEEGETNLQAVIRETKEELTLDLHADELEHLTELKGLKDDGKEIVFNVFLWKFNRALEEIDLKEGAGFKFMTIAEARKVLLLEMDIRVLEAFEEKFKL